MPRHRTALHAGWAGAAAALLLATTGVVDAAVDPRAQADDEVVVDLVAVADTYTRSDQPGRNFGSSVRMSAQAQDPSRTAYVRFDVSIPTGQSVVTATLRLFAVSGGGRTGVDVRAVADDSWGEHSLTAANAPAASSVIAASARSYAAASWVSMDVTELVRSSGPASFALTRAGAAYAGFSSREGGHPPVLTVASAPSRTDPTSAPRDDDVQAATERGWGAPVAGDEFDYTGPPDPARWSVYDSVGHRGNGRRSPSQIVVDGRTATITGTADGTTGGMSARFDRRERGRWETRMRVSAQGPQYRPLLMLWPEAGRWPCDGAVEYAKGDGDPRLMGFTHHFACAERRKSARQSVDSTAWHNYAVEWDEQGIVGYLDGVEWFRNPVPAQQPGGPLHQTVQLDWHPDGTTVTRPTTMEVDWVRVYATSPRPSGTPTPEPSSTPPSPGLRIAAVGDMNPVRNVSTKSPSARNAAAITSRLDAGSLDAFFGLGDFQYSTAFCRDYVDFWRPLWGGTKSRLYWVSAPNHDWQPGRNEDLDDFMDGQCPGDTSKSAINTERGFIGNGEPYSRDFGSWHVAFLSSALWRYDPVRAAELTAWLDRDLAAAKAAGKHLAVVHHEPYFTSDTSAHTRALDHEPWIDVMYEHRVRLTLSGSQHNYERTCPVDSDDRCVADGMTAFQVSTGGIGLRSFTSRPSFIAERFSDTHGWLELDLRADGSFSWAFRPVVGTSTDSGSRAAP